MKKYLVTGMFIVLLSVVTIWSFVVPQRKYSDLENRNLQQFPKVSVKSVLNGNFQEKYETALADQIFLRDNWVDIYAKLEQFIGKKEINDVYLGKDGYLIEKYEEQDFDKKLEEENIKQLSNFLNVTSQQFGKEHVSCMFVPSKINVLDNKMSVQDKEYDGGKVVEQIQQQVDDKSRVINLENILKKHNDEYIYYRTDHHWTTLGAYYGYCAYENMNNRKVAPLKDYKREVVFDDFYGTTYNKAHTFVKPDEVEIFHTDYENVKINMNNDEIKSDTFYFKDVAQKSFDRYQLFFSKNTGKIEIQTSAKNDKTLLVIKDSYANCFVPFLAGEYSKIIMIDCRYTRLKMKTILREYQEVSDILVLFNIEKFRKDTHLTSLKLTKEDLKKEEETQEEDDIFGDLISLD
ncbi:MAG: DHHW family protein [Butyribacter sp.]|nr:DHHW family protein [bacterium]MDY3854810.1 DHHW family protein [Butyribacter sp.]